MGSSSQKHKRYRDGIDSVGITAYMRSEPSLKTIAQQQQLALRFYAVAPAVPPGFPPGSVPPGTTLPVNTVLAALSGPTTLGSTLTAMPGTWTGTPTPTITRQWMRGTAPGTAIAGATGLTYVVVAADQGQFLRVTETATNTAGPVTATTTATSIPAAVAAVTMPAITASFATYTLGAASGTFVSNLSAPYAGATRVVTPATANQFAKSANDLTAVAGVSPPTTTAATSFTVTDTLAGATNSPLSLVVNVTVSAAAAAGTTITTLRLANAGAAPVTNALTQRVVGFARGDVPGAQAGSVRLTVGGTHRQQDAESYYSDGSLKVAVVTIPTGALAAGASTADLPVSYEALAPNRAPVVTTAQVIANSNIRLQIAGGELGADVFEVSVNDIFTSGGQLGTAVNPTRAWRPTAAGPSRCGWQLYGLFTRVSDGAFHRWLTADIFIDALSTTEFTIRARVMQPFVLGAHPSGTVGGATQPRHVFYAELKNSATLVQAWGGPNDTRVTDVAASAFGLDQWLTLSPAGFGFQAPYMLSAAPGGTMPAGMSSTVPVFPIWESGNTKARLFTGRYASRVNAQNNATPWVAGEGINGYGDAVATGSPVARFSNNGIYVPLTAGGVAAAGTTATAPSGATFVDGTLNWTRITASPITAGGAGNVRVTPMLMTVQATGVDLVQMTTGERVRIGGTDHGCVIVPDMWYQAQRAVVHVPFASQEVPAALPAMTYFPGSVHQSGASDLNNAGANEGDERIGYISPTGGVALLRPTDLVSRKTALVVANAWSAYVINLRDHGSGLAHVANNGPNKAGALYAAGMPLRTAMTLPPLASGGVSGASPALVDDAGYVYRYQTWADGSHLPRSFLSPYLLTGDAAYMAAMVSQAVTGLTTNYQSGNPEVVGATTYYRVDTQTPQPQVRADGWALSLLGDTNHLLPASWIESGYIKDVYNDNAAYVAAKYPTFSAVRKAIGTWTARGDTAQTQPWMEHFCGDTRGIEALRGDHPGWKDVYENFHLRFLLDRIDPAKGGCGYWAGVRGVYMAANMDNDAGWTESNWGTLWPASFARFPSLFAVNNGPTPASYTCAATGLYDEFNGNTNGNSINRFPYISAIIATRLGIAGADAVRQQLRTRVIAHSGTGKDYYPGNVNYPAYFFEYEPVDPRLPTAPSITADQVFSVTGAVAGTVVGTVARTGTAATSWAITAGNTGGLLAISAAGVITATGTVSASTFTLSLSATNAIGTGSGSVIVNAAAAIVAGTPPLANGTNVTAAYGFRRTVVGYAGFGVQLGRSSDASTLDVGFIANNDHDAAAADAFIGGGTGTVLKIYNQLGVAAMDLTFTAGNAPAYATSSAALGSRRVARFASNSQMVTTGNLTVGANFLAHTVGTFGVQGPYARMLSVMGSVVLNDYDSGLRGQILAFNQPGTGVQSFSNFQQGGAVAPVTANARTIAAMSKTGASTEIFVGGTGSGATTNMAGFGPNLLYLGKNLNTDPGITGDVAEIILTTDPTMRAALDSNAVAYYTP